MSFSAAKWLNDHSGKFYQPSNGYYYTGHGARYQYYTHAVECSTLEQAINQNIRDEKSILAKQNIVKQHDPKTKENALHVVLSNKIYRFSQSCENSDSLIAVDFRSVEYGERNQNLDYLFGFINFSRFTIEIWGSKAGYVTKYPYYYNESDRFVPNYDRPYHCEPKDRPAFDQWVEAQHQGSEDQLKQFIINNHSVKLQPRIKSVKDRVKEQTPLLISALLEPFAQDDKALCEVLMDRNVDGNTPLHCALLNTSQDNDFLPLVNRVKALSQSQKEELFLARGKQGKNLLHLGSRCDGLNFLIDYGFEFPLNAVAKALSQADDDGNTPFHDFCRSAYAHAHMRFIHQKLNQQNKQESQSLLGSFKQIITPAVSKASEFKEEKEITVSLEEAFAHNSGRVGGHNPLHLACQRKQDAKQDAEIVAMLRDIMGEKLFVAKMKEQDIKRCNPLHYAIATSNDVMVENLLAKLSPKDKKAIAKQANNDKETALHYVCRHGNQKILKLVMEALGPTELFRIYKESENKINKLVKANSNLAFEDFNKLIKSEIIFFDAFEHLENPRFWKFQADIQKRKKDFEACFQRKLKDEVLPPEDLKFTTGRITQDYHQRRIYFRDASHAQLNEFKGYLQSKNSLFARKLLDVKTVEPAGLLGVCVIKERF